MASRISLTAISASFATSLGKRSASAAIRSERVIALNSRASCTGSQPYSSSARTQGFTTHLFRPDVLPLEHTLSRRARHHFAATCGPEHRRYPASELPWRRRPATGHNQQYRKRFSILGCYPICKAVGMIFSCDSQWQHQQIDVSRRESVALLGNFCIRGADRRPRSPNLQGATAMNTLPKIDQDFSTIRTR